MIMFREIQGMLQGSAGGVTKYCVTIRPSLQFSMHSRLPVNPRNQKLGFKKY